MTDGVDFGELNTRVASFWETAVAEVGGNHRERRADPTRESSVSLLRAVSELRASVANNYEYHGNDMAARVAGILASAASTQVHAMSVALLGPEVLAKAAERLAEAADHLAETAAENTDINLGCMVRIPDFSKLDACVVDFRQIAVSKAAG